VLEAFKSTTAAEPSAESGRPPFDDQLERSLLDPADREQVTPRCWSTWQADSERLASSHEPARYPINQTLMAGSSPSAAISAVGVRTIARSEGSGSHRLAPWAGG
jgi:hypothetical protein